MSNSCCKKCWYIFIPDNLIIDDVKGYCRNHSCECHVAKGELCECKTASYEHGFGWRCNECGKWSGNHGGTPGVGGVAKVEHRGAGAGWNPPTPTLQWEEEKAHELQNLLWKAANEASGKSFNHKLNVQFDVIKKFLTEREAEVRAKIQMEYLLAFGNYVPLGGEDSEPETMAKEVIRMWTEKTREETLEEAIGVVVKSRTRAESLGIGMKEHTARAQAAIDLEQMKDKDMSETMGKVDAQIGRAVKRLGEV